MAGLFAAFLIKYGTTFLVFLATFIIAQWFYVVFWSKKNMPPGPIPFPIVGNLPLLGKRLDKSFIEIGKQYGDVFTIYMGGFPHVVLNSYSAIRDALLKKGDAFAGRPNFITFEQTANRRGIVLSQGEVWKLHRKLVTNLLRDFGFGKASLEEKICDEIKMLLHEIKKENGKPFNIHLPLTKAVANVICSVVYGNRYEYDDEVFQSMIQVFNNATRYVGAGAVLNFFPYLRFLPGDLFKLKYLIGTDIEITGFNHRIIDRHVENYDESKVDNFIDAYIGALHKEELYPEKDSTIRMQMAKVLGDFFGAGSETTTTTVRWGILYLIHNPEMQDRIQKEIEVQIGFNRMPSMQDRLNMPFTDAFLCETQRMGNITPLAMFHSTIKDVTFRGYNIPADVTVFPNMTQLMMDPKVFPNPEKFDPQRFINEEGKCVRPESFIPFSIGKRVCVGESLARTELFLFFTSLLQKFTFKLPEGHKLPSPEGDVGITLSPVQFYVCAVE